MKRSEINRVLYITAIIIIAYILLRLFYGLEIKNIIDIRKAWGSVPIVITFWTLYFSFGWKIRWLNQILYKPNLNGTWFGKYSSKSSDTYNNYEGEICLVIRQSFLNTKITSYTGNYMSCSYAENILYSEDNKETKLVYVYSQNQFDPTDDNARKGTAELSLVGKPKTYVLFGDFWTNKDTLGSLRFSRICNQAMSSFEEAKSRVDNNEV